jgi:hypothetical protein
MRMSTPQAAVEVCVPILCPFCALLKNRKGRNRLIYTVGTAGFEPTTSTV